MSDLPALPTQDLFQVCDTGLLIHGSPTYDQWALAFGEMQALWVRSQHLWPWVLGDFVVQGEQRYGEKYAQAITVSGMRIQTLMNYASLCRRFPPERRRAALSPSLHDAVRGLGEREQERWLDWAEEDQGVTRQRLRGAIAARQAMLDAGTISDNGHNLPPAGDELSVLAPTLTTTVRLELSEIGCLLDMAEQNVKTPAPLMGKLVDAWDRLADAIEDATEMEER